MGVVTRTLVTVNIDGQDYTSPLTKANVEVSVTCDNSNCQRGSFNLESNKKLAKVITWVDGDPDNLPSDFYGILAVEDALGDKKVFCSKGCLKSYLLDYTPLRAPSMGNVVPIDEYKQEKADAQNGVFA